MTKCWGPSPRFDEVTKLHDQLGKRDSMHFNNAEEAVFATSQMICDAVNWTCMASMIRTEVEKLINTQRLSGIPPARNEPEATPASSDDDDRTDPRTARFSIPPIEAVEKAVVTSAFNYGKDNLVAEQKMKDVGRDMSPDYGSDDTLR